MYVPVEISFVERPGLSHPYGAKLFIGQNGVVNIIL
jgi:hypothetical protein